MLSEDEKEMEPIDLRPTVSDYQVETIIQEALTSLGESNSDFFSDRKFDPVSKVVDLLLSGKQKQSYQELLSMKDRLDQAIRMLSESRHSEFNDIIYAIEPVEDQLGQL